MTPTFTCVPEEANKLRQTLERKAAQYLARKKSIEKRTDAVFKRLDAPLDSTEKSLAEMEQVADELERATNGPPLEVSGDSSEQDPAKSWRNGNGAAPQGEASQG